jgi:selenocysteine-specific elongation factor
VRASVLQELRSARAPGDIDLAAALTEDLVTRGLLTRDGAMIRLATHVTSLPSADEVRLVEAVRRGEPTPPSVAELVALGFGGSGIDAAVRSGALVRISRELVLTPSFVSQAIEAIEDAGGTGVTVSALRERLGTSRRFAVPLLEHLDRTGVTRRSGDLRFLRSR